MSEERKYTAQEMRKMANRFGHLASNPDCLSVRRPKDQAGDKWGYDAEAESIVQEMLLQASEMMEREEKRKPYHEYIAGSVGVEREKKYEYAIKWHNGVVERGTYDRARTLSEVKGSNIHGVVCKLVRREVGEWEVVNDEVQNS